jgi:hypothetical protein
MIYIVAGCFLVVMICAGLYLLLYAKDYKPSNNKTQAIGQLDTKYSPDMNRFAARKEVKVSADRGQLLANLTTEQTLLKEQIRNQGEARELTARSDYIEHRVNREEEVEDQHALTSMKIDQHAQWLLDEAARRGVAHEILIEQQRSQVKIDEHRALKQVDLEAWMQEKNADIKAALISTLLPHFEAKLLTEDLFRLLDTAYQIQISTDPQKDEKLRIVKKQIKKLEKVVDGKQKLLQGNNG